MTDSTPWQPPAGSAPAVPASPYATAAPPPGPTGWTPPPKPGLIPLRPLTFGTLLGASFQVLRRNPRVTFGFSLLITGIIYLVTVVVVGFVTVYAFSRISFATEQNTDTIASGSFALVLLSTIVPVALDLVGTAILQGIISLEVARGTLGEKLRLPGLWRAARGRIGALIGWSLIVALVVGVALVIIVVAIALLVAFGGIAGVVIGVLLGILFALAGLVLGLWLSTKLALVPSALMLERIPLRAAVARSWRLTKGYFWKTLGTILLVWVIIQVVVTVISTPLQIAVTFGSALLDPNGTSGGAQTAVVVVGVVSIIVTVIFGAIGATALSATPTLIYIDIRMRTEGLDLELARFVEARQAADRSVPDPYLVSTGPTATPGAWP